jgi:chromosome segregation ATPase
MNGTLYLVTEIVVFMVAASVLGFLFGRLMRPRSGKTASRSLQSANAVRDLERQKAQLEAELEATSLLASSRREDSTALMSQLEASAAELAELRAEREKHRVEMSEMGAERDRLLEAVEAQATPDNVAGLREEVAELRAEVTARTAAHDAASREVAELRAELERRAPSTEPFEPAEGGPSVEEQEAEIAQLRAEMRRYQEEVVKLQEALERGGAAPAEGAASLGVSLGGGSFTDTQIEVESPEPGEGSTL